MSEDDDIVMITWIFACEKCNKRMFAVL